MNKRVKSRVSDPREANIKSFMKRFKCSRQQAEWTINDLMGEFVRPAKLTTQHSFSARGAYTREV